jgi:hypothetical protein
VVQGMMRADPRSTGTPQQLLALWLHETSRVFEDRYVTVACLAVLTAGACDALQSSAK